MADKITTQDVLIGGGAFIAGLLIADIVNAKPAAGGCGCSGGHTGTTIPANGGVSAAQRGLVNEEYRRFANAKRIGNDRLGVLSA